MNARKARNLANKVNAIDSILDKIRDEAEKKGKYSLTIEALDEKQQELLVGMGYKITAQPDLTNVIHWSE